MQDKLTCIVLSIQLWTSELVRTHQTAEHICATSRTIHPELNELDSGDYDDLTYEDFERLHPEEFAAREADKLCFRYPGGESYVDLCRWVENRICGKLNVAW